MSVRRWVAPLFPVATARTKQSPSAEAIAIERASPIDGQGMRAKEANAGVSQAAIGAKVVAARGQIQFLPHSAVMKIIEK